MWYILKDKKPVPASTEEAGAFMMDFAKKVVKQEYVGDIFVSTVFLTLDHRMFGEGDPLLFETMIFNLGGDDTGGFERRCCTWEQAEDQHELAVDWVKEQVASAAELTRTVLPAGED